MGMFLSNDMKGCLRVCYNVGVDPTLQHKEAAVDNSVAVLPLDIHKRFSMATPMSQDGEVLKKVRLEHGDRAGMEALLVELAQGADVVMEATFNWPWIADLVQEVGLSPHLADPRETGRMRKNKPKSDRKDAIFLGKLWLGGDIFPEACLAPPAVRRLRAASRKCGIIGSTARPGRHCSSSSAAPGSRH